MRVDPKRPLLGFALVAVLCAVLMSLSVSRGWGFDLFQPGKPIASSRGGHVERVPAPAPDPAEPVEVGIPVELSPQPLAAQPRVPAKKAVATSSKAAKSSAVATAPTMDQQVADESSAATRVERRFARLEAKAQRKADREAAKLQRRVEKSAAHARRQAVHAAAKAAKDAAKDAERAARDLEKAARKL